MRTIRISASGRYEVRIGPGLLDGAGEQIKAVSGPAETAAVVTDDTVDALHAGKVVSSLERAGFRTVKFVLPHGEASKNPENYIRILNFLAEARLTRGDLLAALGGGMTGDIGAFAAATYLRGIRCVQLPTTLLADVDSSVGGKTAIDLGAGKNLAGAFCQPALVLCDTQALETLPAPTFADGCAEVVKYGVLADPALFSHLEERGLGFDREYVVSRCVDIKRSYVEADEFDTGARRQLNLGHTLGHAVEAKSDYALSHGRAVAIGLAVVCRAAAARGVFPENDARRVCALLKKLGLPTGTDYTIDELFSAMLSDKKRVGQTVNAVVPEAVGRCRVQPMGLDELKEFMKAGL